MILWMVNPQILQGQKKTNLYGHLMMHIKQDYSKKNKKMKRRKLKKYKKLKNGYLNPDSPFEKCEDALMKEEEVVRGDLKQLKNY